MTEKFQLIIQTPEKEVFSGEISSLYISTDTGDTEIYSNHAAFGAVISYSPIIISISKDQTIEYIVKRGVLFFSNNNNEARLMVYSAEKREEIDFDSAKEYLNFIMEKLEKGENTEAFTYQFLEDEKLALVKQFDLDQN